MTENNFNELLNELENEKYNIVEVPSVENFSYLTKDIKELKDIALNIIDAATEEEEKEKEEFEKLKNALESNNKEELGKLIENFMTKRITDENYKIYDDEIKDYIKMKELQKRQKLYPEEKKELECIEQRLNYIIGSKNKENNIKELIKFKEHQNKYYITFPGGKINDNYKRNKKLVIFDRESIYLKEYNENSENKYSTEENIQKKFEYKEVIDKNLFFRIIKNINENENSIYLKTNNNGINIAYIILKYCLDKQIVNIEDFMIYYNHNINYFNDERITKIFCKIGNVEIIKRLIINGVKLDKIDTPFSISGPIDENIFFGNSSELAYYIINDLHMKIDYLALKAACIGSKFDNVTFLIDNYNWNKDDLIRTFNYIKDLRIANRILNELRKIDSIDNKDKNRKTILDYAIESGNQVMISFLNKQPELTLKNALKENDFKKIKQIIEYMKKNQIKLAKEHKNNILPFFVYKVYRKDKNALDMVKFLLEQTDIDINTTDNKYNKTALHLALELNLTEIVELIISKMKEKKLNLAYEDKNELLYIAIKKDNPNVVELLLSMPNINVNAKNEYKNTPLKEALKKGNPKIIELILSKEDLEINNEKYNINYSFKKAIEDKRLDIIEVLIEKIEKENKILKDNKDKLFNWSIENDNLKIFEFLLQDQLKEQTSENKKNFYDNLIFKTITFKSLTILKFLLSEPGIDINAEDCWKDTPLHLALRMKDKDIIGILLSRSDININAINDCEETPLHLALRMKNRDIIRFLYSKIKDKKLEIDQNLDKKINDFLNEKQKTSKKKKSKKTKNDTEENSNIISNDEENLDNIEENSNIISNNEEKKDDIEKNTNRISSLNEASTAFAVLTEEEEISEQFDSSKKSDEKDFDY